MVEGNLYGLILPASPKFGDLKRDGRYALHTFPPVDVDDEFLVMGSAHLVNDAVQASRVRDDQKARGMTSTEDDALFRFDIDRVMFAKYAGGHGSWPPKYMVWKERPGPRREPH